jgi:hypothetical protein
MEHIQHEGVSERRVGMPTPAELRAKIAFLGLPLYIVAARAGMHPTRLGMVLNERLPLRPDLAEKIAGAIAEAPPPAA